MNVGGANGITKLYWMPEHIHGQGFLTGITAGIPEPLRESYEYHNAGASPVTNIPTRYKDSWSGIPGWLYDKTAHISNGVGDGG